MSLRTLGQWVVFPLLNAFFWYYISHARSSRSPCPIPAVAVAAATTEIVFSTTDEATAALVRSLCDVLSLECARCGCALARISCAGPAPRPMLPAA